MSWCQFCKDRSNFFNTIYCCTISGKEVEIPASYYDYCKHDYYVSSCPFYKQYGTSSSGCFITTVICDVLNKEDDSEVIQNLRNFRDNVLQKNDKYSEILKIYDTIGPILASKIIQDENRDSIASEIYTYTLEPISNLINEENYAAAVKHYFYMTLYLINEYNLARAYNFLVDNNFGYKKDEHASGHGCKGCCHDCERCKKQKTLKNA